MEKYFAFFVPKKFIRKVCFFEQLRCQCHISNYSIQFNSMLYFTLYRTFTQIILQTEDKKGIISKLRRGNVHMCVVSTVEKAF